MELSIAGVSPTALAQRDRLRRKQEDERERLRKEREAREAQTSWLPADHTHFAHPHHFHRHPSQHRHPPVTKALLEYPCEHREKMIPSYSKAAHKGFRMAAKASASAAKAEICAQGILPIVKTVGGRRGR